MNFEQLADELKRLRGPHQNLQQAKILEQYPDAPDAARVLYEAQNKKLERALKSPSDRPQIQKPVSTRDDSEFDNAVSQRVRARMQSGSKGSVDSLSPLNSRLGAYQAAAARRKNKSANPGSTTADRVAARREQYGEFQPASNTARGVAQILAGKGKPTSSEEFGNGSRLEQYADGSEGLIGVDRTVAQNKATQSSRLLANRAASREREQARKSAVNQAVVAALNGGEYQPTGNAKNDTAAMNVFRNRREQMAQQDAQGRQMLMALAGQSPGGAQAYLNQMGANQRMGAEQQMLGQELASRERIAALQSGESSAERVQVAGSILKNRDSFPPNMVASAENVIADALAGNGSAPPSQNESSNSGASQAANRNAVLLQSQANKATGLSPQDINATKQREAEILIDAIDNNRISLKDAMAQAKQKDSTLATSGKSVVDFMRAKLAEQAKEYRGKFTRHQVMTESGQGGLYGPPAGSNVPSPPYGFGGL